MALTTFTAINLKRHLLNGPNLVFSMFLPILLFLLFGALQDYGAVMLKNGNVTAYVMVGMAVYGGITAAVSTVGTTVVEQSTGWGRQLALTPLTGTQLLLSQCVVNFVPRSLPSGSGVHYWCADFCRDGCAELGADVCVIRAGYAAFWFLRHDIWAALQV